MNNHTLALYLLFAQGLMGAYDTVYHHELRATLPQQVTAMLELKIHAVRAMLYGVVFAGLAWFVFGGIWFWVLTVLVLIEVGLTLWDFLVEDQSRQLPWSERVLHTVLAMNGGAAFGLMATQAPDWLALPNALVIQTHGWLTPVLSVFAVGVFLSGIRDARAAQYLSRQQANIPSATHQESTMSHAIEPNRPALQILITGGTGFIGRNLVQHWLAQGHRVTILTRSPHVATHLFGGRVSCVRSFDELPPNHVFDLVVNLAGAPILGPRWTMKRRQILRDSRVGLTEKLVAWMQAAHQPPRVFISGSAIGYYGIQAAGDNNALTETSPSQPIFMSQLCQDWEAASEPARTFTQVITLRLGVVFGVQNALPAMLLPIKLGLGGRMGRGNQWLSWIHIADVVHAIEFLSQQALANVSAANQVNAPRKIYNLVSPNAVPQAEFVRVACQVHHRPNWFPTPAAPVKLLLGEQADLLLEGQRVTPDNLLAAGFEFNYPDLESALSALR